MVLAVSYRNLEISVCKVTGRKSSGRFRTNFDTWNAADSFREVISLYSAKSITDFFLSIIFVFMRRLMKKETFCGVSLRHMESTETMKFSGCWSISSSFSCSSFLRTAESIVSLFFLKISCVNSRISCCCIFNSSCSLQTLTR